MRCHKLTLPLPPSKNNSHGFSRSGGVYLLKSVRLFREEVWLAIKQKGIRTIHGPCRLTATFHPARAGTFDQANRMTQLLDALEHAGLVVNDKQFTDTHSTLGEIVRPTGRCVVDIREIE